MLADDLTLEASLLNLIISKRSFTFFKLLKNRNFRKSSEHHPKESVSTPKDIGVGCSSTFKSENNLVNRA